MKKLLLIATILGAMLQVQAQQVKPRSFLTDTVMGYPLGGTQSWGGITISNAASAPLGGYTNILSWNNSTTAPLVQGTNCPRLTWTNNNGIWVIPTNGVPGTLSGVSFVQGPDVTQLTRDLDLWLTTVGGTPVIQASNTWASDGNSYPLSPASISCRIIGDTGAATKLDLVFVGLPDGVNEVPDVAGPFPKFNWGIVPIAGTTVAITNFPAWKFAGCSKIRLRSATLTTSTAANIGVTIQALTLNGYVP